MEVLDIATGEEHAGRACSDSYYNFFANKAVGKLSPEASGKCQSNVSLTDNAPTSLLQDCFGWRMN
jgi:hypothetical protein